MAMTPQGSLVFKVWRCEAELVCPAKPAPREYERLSDVDDQDGPRFQVLGMQFYRGNGMGRDPARAIRERLAKALVFYYPFADCLREWPGQKLAVDCNKEEVVFVEANANVTLDDVADALQPSFPCSEELLSDIPNSSAILNLTLLLI